MSHKYDVEDMTLIFRNELDNHYAVWFDDVTGARCSRCSGSVVAMSSSCSHAQAVKRHVEKHRSGSKAGEK